MFTTKKTTMLFGLVTAIVLSVSACSGGTADSSSTSSKTSASSADGSLANAVPEDIRKAGVIKGGSNFSAKPIDYYDDQHKPAGVMIDLLTAAAKRLELKIQWTDVAYPALIPALRTGQITIAGAQLSKTEANAGVVNYFAFYQASSSLLVKKGTSFSAVTDLCGTNLGVTSGSTVDQATAADISEKCQKADKPKVTVRPYASPTAGSTAVRSGQVDSYLEGTPQIVGQVEAQPEFAIAFKAKFAKRDTGVALSKKDLALTKAFQKAMNAMIADGEYTKILKKWNLESIGIDKTLVNDEIQVP